MGRYIDESKIKLLSENALIDDDGAALIPLADVKRAIAMTPTEDVHEVRHGKWITIHGMAPPEDHGKHKCSLCGGKALNRNFKEYLSDWCPHCGALMDLKE